MVTPLFINRRSLSEAVSSPPLAAMQPDAASSLQRSCEKAASSRMFAHQEILIPRRSSSSASSFSTAGGAASSTK